MFVRPFVRALPASMLARVLSTPSALDETIDVWLGGTSFVVRADGSREPGPFFHFAPFGGTNALEVP